MIRIHRPREAPPSLLADGPAATQRACLPVDVGQTRAFEARVYGARDVKASLSAAQHDKCCFCESKLGHAQFGDVEHFRPKVRYYWLAYTWDNLLLSCEVCNRRHKRGEFPLEDERLAVRSHVEADRIADERPVFIDPSREDPSTHLEFRREYVAAANSSPRGRVTIEAIGLNRTALAERRRERRSLIWGCIVALRERLSAADGDADCLGLVAALSEAASSQGEFAALGRAVLRAAIPWCDLADGTKPIDLLTRLREGLSNGRTIDPRAGASVVPRR